MVEIQNVEDSQGNLVCVVYMDKRVALRLASSILKQVNAGTPNVEGNTFLCDGEADQFKVAVL